MTTALELLARIKAKTNTEESNQHARSNNNGGLSILRSPHLYSVPNPTLGLTTQYETQYKLFLNFTSYLLHNPSLILPLHYHVQLMNKLVPLVAEKFYTSIYYSMRELNKELVGRALTTATTAQEFNAATNTLLSGLDKETLADLATLNDKIGERQCHN